MINATAIVLFYGLVAAASPLALTATLVVIRSDRPRINSLAFLTGFVLGAAIACALGLVLGQAALDRLDSHETIEAVIALLLGVALVGTGLRERHAPQRNESDGSRGGAILAGLAHVRPAAAMPMAGLLGFGGPKRLLLTFLAMGAISEAGLGVVESLALVVVYLVVATMIVSVPVTMVMVAGARAAALLQDGESWLKTNAAVLRVWLALGLGAALVVSSLVRLIA